MLICLDKNAKRWVIGRTCLNALQSDVKISGDKINVCQLLRTEPVQKVLVFYTNTDFSSY